MQFEVVLVSLLALLTSWLCADAQDNDVYDMQSETMSVFISESENSGIFIRSLRWFLLVFTSILTALMSFVCWLACAPALIAIQKKARNCGLYFYNFKKS